MKGKIAIRDSDNGDSWDYGITIDYSATCDGITYYRRIGNSRRKIVNFLLALISSRIIAATDESFSSVGTGSSAISIYFSGLQTLGGTHQFCIISPPLPLSKLLENWSIAADNPHCSLGADVRNYLLGYTRSHRVILVARSRAIIIVMKNDTAISCDIVIPVSANKLVFHQLCMEEICKIWERELIDKNI